MAKFSGSQQKDEDYITITKKTYPIETYALVLNDPIVDAEKLRRGFSYIVAAHGYSIVSPDVEVSLDYDIDENEHRTIVEARIIKRPDVAMLVSDKTMSVSVAEPIRLL